MGGEISPAGLRLAQADFTRYADFRYRITRFRKADNFYYDLIASHDTAGFYVLMHYDGYIRERAIRSINCAAPNPFFFCSLVYRLNDWVPEIRIAAENCFNRVLRKTDPAIFSETSIYLLNQIWFWGRAQESLGVLKNAFSQPTAMSAVAESLKTHSNGPLARVCRNATRFDSIDPHLESIATDAINPSVRAVALEALIDGRATWFDGQERQILEDAKGIKRRVARADTRTLSYVPDRSKVIAHAAMDPAIIVRKQLAQLLVRNRSSLPDQSNIALKLLNDRSPSVREMAENYLRKMNKLKN